LTEAKQYTHTDTNIVLIEGRLIKDAEYRVYQDETGWAEFCIATTIRTGKDTFNTSFIDCTLFGKRAGKLSKRLLKGTAVLVEGQLNIRKWMQQGQPRYKTELRVTEIKAIGKFPQASEEVLSGQNLVDTLKDKFDADFGDESNLPF
jgi:single-strand DNA-binding protein